MSTALQHLLVLSSWYPNRRNPHLGNFVQRQARIISLKSKVTVLHVVCDPSIRRTEVETNQSENLIELTGYFPHHKWWIIRFIREYFLFRKLLLSIQRPDIIHGHVSLPKGYLFLRAKRIFNCPLVITEHGSYFEPTKQSTWNWRMRSLFKRIVRKANQFIAVSEVLKQDMQPLLESTSIDVIPNMINTKLFVPTNSPSKEINFLHVSTLDEKIKNVTGILEAFHQYVLKGHSTAHLTIISDEPYEELKKSCEYKYPRLPVTFIGPLTEVEIVPYFQKCSAFILNSRYETFSIVIAEAWSCGKPVLSTPVGIASNLPDKLGISVEIDNVHSMVRAMEEFTLRREQYDAHEIREHALKMDSAVVHELLNEVYGRYIC